MIRITKGDGNYFRLYTPYDADFVTAFKEAISRTYREPVRNDNGRFGYWKVHQNCLEEVLDIIREYYPKQEINISELGEEPTQTTNWVADIFKACPTRHRSKLYRSLASAFHPDVGGGHELMVRINNEYEKFDKNDR